MPTDDTLTRAVARRAWSAAYGELREQGADEQTAMARADIVRIEVERALAPTDDTRPDPLRRAQKAVVTLLDRIDYVNGADAREIVAEVRESMAALAASPATDRLRERIEGLTKFEMADWPGQDFLLYEDVVALAAEPGAGGGLDVDKLAVAINDAQVRPDELQLGRDLRIPAGRILAALEAAR